MQQIPVKNGIWESVRNLHRQRKNSTPKLFILNEKTAGLGLESTVELVVRYHGVFDGLARAKHG